jgi:DNA (cytosine-5)-methyltransferase 1
VSLFSGGGLSDIGYAAAGFEFVAHLERELERATIGCRTHRGSRWFVGDVRVQLDSLIEFCRATGHEHVDLLVATPPCQGMSSSNPSRGKRSSGAARRNEARNSLLLQLVAAARALSPRVIVAENVRQILTLRASFGAKRGFVVDLLREHLPDYEFWSGVVNVADHGVPQDRRRALIVGARRGEPWVGALSTRLLLPWPRPTHAEVGDEKRLPWVSVKEWMEFMGYEKLDARTPELATGDDPLHFVPSYDEQRYGLVKDIPKNSGRSAYENSRCPSCHQTSVPVGLARCAICGLPLWNRPIVGTGRHARLIKGFASSYRRMRPDRPAATITTNSSHIGSDFKIHPSEHRVLSILECADLQTVPRWFDWAGALELGQAYLVRNLIGEAFPPYFTMLHGKVLIGLLEKGRVELTMLARSVGECRRDARQSGDAQSWRRTSTLTSAPAG